MTLLAGCTSFFIGNAYSAQMPGFAADLGHGDPGVSYSMLLAADAAGALLAGIVLEGRALLPARARTAIVLACLWCCALAAFAIARIYPLALVLLFTAGFFELPSTPWRKPWCSSTHRLAIRGRVIGLYNMASLGLRAFSGVTVGLIGSVIGVHWSLALSAMAVLACALGLLGWLRRAE